MGLQQEGVGLSMPEQSAEEAVRSYGRAVVEGDMGVIVSSMTPDGMARLMEISDREWFSYSDYELTQEARDGDDYLFDVAYETSLGSPLQMRYRVRDVGGSWKVVDDEQIAPAPNA